MSRGFITLGIDTDLDKVKYSYALALSIKNCDPTAEVCLVVDAGKSDLVSSKYFHAFDYIVELPFGNTGHADGFHGSNMWQMIHCTPFAETIYVDYDTLFLNVDIDLLWDQFENYDLAVTSFARTYKNLPTNKANSFEIELKYELPLLYNQLMYFDSASDTAQEWFKLADPYFQNWRSVYNSVFTEMKPASFDKNIICNIITEHLDITTSVVCNLNNFYDIDTVSQHLWTNDVPNDWTELFNSWFDIENGLLIENSLIRSGIVHYRDENFISEEILNELRNKFNRTSQKAIDAA